MTFKRKKRCQKILKRFSHKQLGLPYSMKHHFWVCYGQTILLPQGSDIEIYFKIYNHNRKHYEQKLLNKKEGLL